MLRIAKNSDLDCGNGYLVQYMKLLITGILITVSLALFSQERPEIPPIPQFYHQIFLKDTIETIEDVIYLDDSTQIEFRISPDRTAIYLLNYDGKRSIRATIRYKTGDSKEVTKPHCQIHGLQHL